MRTHVQYRNKKCLFFHYMCTSIYRKHYRFSNVTMHLNILIKQNLITKSTVTVNVRQIQMPKYIELTSLISDLLLKLAILLLWRMNMYYFPAGTQRLNGVVSRSMERRYIAADTTLFWPCMPNGSRSGE